MSELKFELKLESRKKAGLFFNPENDVEFWLKPAVTKRYLKSGKVTPSILTAYEDARKQKELEDDAKKYGKKKYVLLWIQEFAVESDKAVKLGVEGKEMWFDGDDQRWDVFKWIPKSLCHIVGDNVYVQEWFLDKEGIVAEITFSKDNPEIYLNPDDANNVDWDAVSDRFNENKRAERREGMQGAFEVGVRLIHKDFGEGVVTWADETFFEVEFDVAKKKKDKRRKFGKGFCAERLIFERV